MPEKNPQIISPTSSPIMPAATPMPTDQSYESMLGQYAFRAPSEKTFIDKLLSRKEVDALQNLIEKPDLTRQDLLKLLYMLTGAELKLSNLGDYDRYLLGKYFTWVRDLVKVAEFLYDYISQIDSYKFSPEGTQEIKDTLEAVKKMMLHDVKFSADIFLFLTRSSMGLSALAFDTLSKGRYEYEYSGYPTTPAASVGPQKSSWNPFKR
jgi:hypothetical protein